MKIPEKYYKFFDGKISLNPEINNAGLDFYIKIIFGNESEILSSINQNCSVDCFSNIENFANELFFAGTPIEIISNDYSEWIVTNHPNFFRHIIDLDEETKVKYSQLVLAGKYGMFTT